MNIFSHKELEELKAMLHDLKKKRRMKPMLVAECPWIKDMDITAIMQRPNAR